MSRFTVEFMGEAPDGIKVGDELLLSGIVTVRQMTADLVDITGYATDPAKTEVLICEVSFDLFSNKMSVTQL